MGRLDTTFKELIAHHLASLLPWLLPGYEVDEIKVEPSTLPATSRDVDLLVQVVRRRGSPKERALNILESQCQRDDSIHKTMFLRAAIAHCKYDLPVTSILLAFTEAAAIEPEYVYGRSDQGPLVHRVVVRRIYEESADQALELDLPHLLPLVPAMKPAGGDRGVLLGQILERIARLPVSQEERNRLMGWAATFATLNLKKQQVQTIVEEVFRRNKFMLDPLRDFPMLRETYEEGEREGERKGEEKGRKESKEEAVRMLQETAIELCQVRFGADRLGTERIRRINDFGQLSRLVIKLGTAQSLAEALATLPVE